MLVTFESPVGRITLFGNVATRLIRMMGHSGTLPGALLAEDIPAALAHLKRALADAEPTPADDATEEPGDDERDAPVSLRHRAFPLIRLLEDAQKLNYGVMWEQQGTAPLKF